jgi:serine/threonine protein kinase
LCLTHDEVVAFLGDVLDSAQRDEIERHLDACAECLELITLVSKTSLARGSLQRDVESPDSPNPSDDHFENYRDFVIVDPKHYVMGHEIARGGVGRIIAARDRRHGRHVAIKVPLTESHALRVRFEREARITAKLQHPAIVNLLEAGTWPSGEPFYVMKLVTGKSLDERIARHATLHARLSLLPHVIAAVDALAYAHSERVIHRDLKPANVLVGEFGETVVIDWGLAKDLVDTHDATEVAVDRDRMIGLSGATLDGSIIGTPAYMPAEQARGDAVDERADVHALGAMLYHLLAGVPPYTGASPDAILAAVIAGPPQPLATLVSGVPPDLITIVNKAMARATVDRYPTAKELAEDLKRFQTGQLVNAHPYSPWQLLRRWIRRHRTSLAVSAVAALVLGALGIASLHRIVREQARAEEQRQIAERSRNEAEDLMGFMLGDIREWVQPLGRLEMLDEIAKKAAAYYAGRPVGASSLELEKRARARTTLGDVLADQGHADAALEEYRAALALFQRLEASDAMSADRLLAVTTSHANIARVLRAQGNVRAALVEYRAAVASGERAVRIAPNDRSQRTVAIVNNAIADTMVAQGDLQGALDHYRATLAIAKSLATRNQQDDDGQRFLLTSHLDVGKAHVLAGSFAQALREFQAALAIGEAQAAKDPTNADVQRYRWLTHTMVGDAVSGQGDYKRDLVEYRAALAIAKELATKDSTNARRQYEVSLLHHRVGVKLDARGERVLALEEFMAALAIDKQLVAKDATNTDWQVQLAKSHLQCAVVYAAQGQLTRALDVNRAGLAIVEALVAKDSNNAEWQSLLAGA